MLVAEFRRRRIDRLLRHALERTSGPHRIELHLRRALEVIEQVVRLGDGLADRRHAVVRHHQHRLVADRLGEPLALGRIVRRAVVAIVIGGVDRSSELGLADRQDLRILEPGQRARERHVGMEHRRGLRQ